MATTYYVQADGGSDNNPGTESRPFKTIQYAVNKLSPGDTLLVRKGTYVEMVRITRSGTTSAAITIAAYPGEQPVIDGRAGVNGLNSGLPNTVDSGWVARDGTTFTWAPLVSIEANFVIFDGIDITRSRGRGLRIWTNDAYTRGVTIQNCRISYSLAHGLMLINCDGIVIENCDISRSCNFAPYNRPSSELNWPGAVGVKASKNVRIERTIVRENWGEGIIADVRTSKSSDIIIRGCEVYDNMRPSIYLQAVRNVLVEGCLVYHSDNPEFPDMAGIAITPSEPDFSENIPVENIKIVNNIIVGFAVNIALWPSTGRDFRAVELIYNTLINATSSGLSGFNKIGEYENCSFINNLVFQSNGKPLINGTSGFTGWKISHNAWSSQPPSYISSATDVIGDPKLANPKAERVRGEVDPTWYTLLSSSPAISKATPISTVLDDFFENRRDDKPDIGGHEFLSNTIKSNFSVSPTQGQAPLLVQFTDQSTATQPITSWFWDFGDGSISTEQNPKHEYKQGTFSVSLRVSTGTLDDIQTKQNIISVQAPEINAPKRVTDGLAVLFRFDEGTGEIINDVSGVGRPLDLRITEPAKVSWLRPGLKITSPTVLASTGPAEKINEACRKTNQISLEVWIKAENTSQKGPARIVSISQNSYSRNITLGQGLWGDLPSDLYDIRLRTTERSANGMPSFSSSAGSLDLELHHIVFTRGSSGTARIYIDGTIIAEAIIPGDFSTWNPRFPLLIGNETTAEFPWLGEIYLMAIYDRALTSSEVIINRDAGIPVQQLPEFTPISIETFKRFLIVSNGSAFTSAKTLAFGVQYPDQRCVVCANNGSHGMTIFDDAQKAVAEYDSQRAVVKWID